MDWPASSAGGDQPEGSSGHRDLDESTEATLRRYAALLAEAPLNLVSARDRDDVWSRHIIESVEVCRHLPIVPRQRWLDLGTGGGLPGVVLAVLHPTVAVTLLDARQKKIRALEHFVAELGLAQVTAVVGRAEQLARVSIHRGRYDGVTCRAVDRLVTSVELARGFVRDGGVIAVVRGRDAHDERESLESVREALGVTDVHVVAVATEPRVAALVTMRADGPPPRWIPRRNGLPRTQPLDLPRRASE